MTDQDRQMGFLSRVLVGFIAGFWATLVFHQLDGGLPPGSGRGALFTIFMDADRTFRDPRGALTGILGRRLGHYLYAHRWQVSARGRLLGCGIPVRCGPSFSGRPSSGPAAQGTTHGRRLARASARGRVLCQWCLGYRHRGLPQGITSATTSPAVGPSGLRSGRREDILVWVQGAGRPDGGNGPLGGQRPERPRKESEIWNFSNRVSHLRFHLLTTPERAQKTWITDYRGKMITTGSAAAVGARQRPRVMRPAY